MDFKFIPFQTHQLAVQCTKREDLASIFSSDYFNDWDELGSIIIIDNERGENRFEIWMENKIWFSERRIAMTHDWNRDIEKYCKTCLRRKYETNTSCSRF